MYLHQSVLPENQAEPSESHSVAALPVDVAEVHGPATCMAKLTVYRARMC